jgi:hypothetical protein
MDIKPNKKTWIIGTAGKAPIKYPPVVPMMTTQVRDELIDLFAKHLAVVPSTSDLQRKVADLDKLSFLSSVQMRQLKQYHAQLDELEQQIEKARREAAPKAKSYALNLCLLRGVTSVGVIGDCVRFTTSPIAISGVVLGCYDVMLNLKYTVPASAILAHRHGDRPRQGLHPHWSEHNPCFGYAGPVLDNLLRAKRWPEAIGVLMTYLATYYASSPLIKLEEFKPNGWHYSTKAIAPDDREDWWEWKFPDMAQARRTGIDWAQRSPDPHIPF